MFEENLSFGYRAVAALEQAVIIRFGCPTPFLLRSDNALAFTRRNYTALVKSYGLRQEFITLYSPEQNDMAKRVIRTLKEQCEHRQRFETLQHASRVIGDRIQFYNHNIPPSDADNENVGGAYPSRQKSPNHYSRSQP